MDIQLRAAEYEITKSEYDLAYPRLNYIIEKNDVLCPTCIKNINSVYSKK